MWAKVSELTIASVGAKHKQWPSISRNNGVKRVARAAASRNTPPSRCAPAMYSSVGHHRSTICPAAIGARKHANGSVA